jgi:hypothetical protein
MLMQLLTLADKPVQAGAVGMCLTCAVLPFIVGAYALLRAVRKARKRV